MIIVIKYNDIINFFDRKEFSYIQDQEYISSYMRVLNKYNYIYKEKMEYKDEKLKFQNKFSNLQIYYDRKHNKLTHNLNYNIDEKIINSYRNNPLIIDKISIPEINFTHDKISSYFLIFDIEARSEDFKNEQLRIESIGYVIYLNNIMIKYHEFFLTENKKGIPLTSAQIALNFFLSDIMYYQPCIIGYNIKNFDFLILKKLYPTHQLILSGCLNEHFDFYLYLYENQNFYNISKKSGSLKLSTLLDIYLGEIQKHEALEDCFHTWKIFNYFLKVENLLEIQVKNNMYDNEKCICQ